MTTTDTRAVRELLDCPFDGATPHHGPTKQTTGQDGESFQRYRVWCPHGCAQIEEVNREQAFARWNRRADPVLADNATTAVVKPLEWRGEPPYHMARTAFGAFYCAEAIWDENKFVHVKLSGPLIRDRTYPTVEAAKAAAQADYERRIRSALASPPAPTRGVSDEMARAFVRKYREFWPGAGWPALDDAKVLIAAALAGEK